MTDGPCQLDLLRSLQTHCDLPTGNSEDVLVCHEI